MRRWKIGTPLVLLVSHLLVGCADSDMDAESAPIRFELAESESLPGDFTFATSVSELSDGRVLVADRGETLLKLLSPATGEVEFIGRKGEGPGEFQAVTHLVALGADSSALYDARLRRLLTLSGGELLRAMQSTMLDIHDLRSNAGVIGADTLGNLLLGIRSTTSLPSGTGSRSNLLDSLIVLKATRDLREIDTIARLPLGSQVWIQRARPTQITNPFAPSEQVSISSDGWIAIARLDPYRVEWIEPNGERIQGAPLPLEPVRFDSRELDARFGPGSAATLGEQLSLPDYLPAFLPDLFFASTHGVLVHAPDGNLLVRRALPADSGHVRYDVVDRRGNLAGHLILEEGELIIDSSPKHLYILSKDSLDLQRIRRSVLRRGDG